MKIKKSIYIILSLLAVFCLFSTPVKCDTLCTLDISSSPAGADIYIDGEFTDFVTPHIFSLEQGSYLIELKIPGYKTYSQTVTLTQETTTLDNVLIHPDLIDCDSEHTIVVNTLDDKSRWTTVSEMENLSINDLKTSSLPISLREAIEAVKNEPIESGHYTIEFDPNLSGGTIEMFSSYHVVPEGYNQWLYIDKRGNMTINGDIDNDGDCDITLDVSTNGTPNTPTSCIMWISSSNAVINGLRFYAGEEYYTYNTLSLRTPCDNNQRYDLENIKIFGCDFYNSIEVGIATCGVYGNASSAAGEKTTNYNNVYFCGNTSVNTIFFNFAGAGDEDYNKVTNFFFCANTLDGRGFSMLTGDAHSWYVFGKNSVNGSGISGEEIGFCEYNTIDGVLISGNDGGYISLESANMGNNHNITQNFMIRNNISENIEITCVSAIPDSRYTYYNTSPPLRHDTHNNTLKNITVKNNVFTEPNWSPALITNVSFSHVEMQGMDATDNILENIYFYNNTFNCSGLAISNLFGYHNMYPNEFSGNITRNVVIDNNTFINNNNQDCIRGIVITGVYNEQNNHQLNFHDNDIYDISFTNNTVSGYDCGITVSGCFATSKDGEFVRDIIVDSNTVECNASGTYGIIVAGNNQGGYDHNGSVNCYAKDITVSNNNITAPGGILLAASNNAGHNSVSGNYIDNILVSNNHMSHIDVNGERYFGITVSPFLTQGMYEENINVKDLKVTNYTLENNTFENFEVNIVDLCSRQNTYKRNELASSYDALRVFTDYTESLFGAESYWWHWKNDVAPDITQPGQYVAFGYYSDNSVENGIEVIAVPVCITDEIHPDFNHDGSVDMLDISILAQHYNQSDEDYDITSDSIVNLFDMVSAAKDME